MIKFVYQNKPLGTGDAVLKTKKYIKDNFFLMLLPDDLIIKKLLQVYDKHSQSLQIFCYGKYACK